MVELLDWVFCTIKGWNLPKDLEGVLGEGIFWLPAAESFLSIVVGGVTIAERFFTGVWGEN